MNAKIRSSVAVSILISIAIIGRAQSLSQHLPVGNKHLRQAKVFSGKVTGWITNLDFIYDGFYLQAEGEKYLVKFSPVLGNQLTTAFKIGDVIAINAVEVADSQNQNIIRLVDITTNGMNIYDAPTVFTAEAPAEEFIYGSGKITELQENKQGEIKGFILSDKTILRIPLYAAQELNKIGVVGAFVSYSGSQIMRHGEFAPITYTIVLCKTITINEKQYLID